MTEKNLGLTPEDEAELEVHFKKALEDGPVVLLHQNRMYGFKDVPSALAYIEATNIAAGKPQGGRVLVVGPNSKAEIDKMIAQDKDKEGGL